MFDFFEHYKKTGYLHHAHVIVGMNDAVLPVLVSELERHLGIETRGNPDVTIKFYESLGVNEAKEIRDAEKFAGFGGAKKIFVIGTESFTHQAQNALLKTFEEPTLDTHFFIILPRKEMLLPTLLSRVLVVSPNILLGSRPRLRPGREFANSESADSETKELAEKFLDATLSGRFAIAKKMADKKPGETVDRELFRRMLDHIERILYTRTAANQQIRVLDQNRLATANIFREIFVAKTYLANPGSSPKMLLEHIAIIL